MTHVRELFGKQIRSHRLTGGLSQESLAALMTDAGCPMHQTAICKIENGQRLTDLDEAFAFARVLSVELPELLADVVADVVTTVTPQYVRIRVDSREIVKAAAKLE